MEKDEIKQAAKDVLNSISKYCKLLVRSDDSPCCEGDCEFCPINQAYEMIQDSMSDENNEDEEEI